MKKLHLSLLLALLSLLANAQMPLTTLPANYGYRITLGETVPNFTLELPNGTCTTMLDLRGRVVMLQFTASWCSVCRKEMPHIEQDIWQKHKNNPKFSLYGIDLKEDAQTICNFQSETKVTYPIALDKEGQIFALFTKENAGVTRNIIIDKTGKIVFATRLFKQAEFETMKQVINRLLAE